MFKLKVHSNQEKNIDKYRDILRYIYKGIEYVLYVRLDDYIYILYTNILLGVDGKKLLYISSMPARLRHIRKSEGIEVVFFSWPYKLRN